MLDDLKSYLSDDLETTTALEAAASEIALDNEEFRDAFLDDPDNMVVGAENDPGIAKLVEKLPVVADEVEPVSQADIKKVIENYIPESIIDSNFTNTNESFIDDDFTDLGGSTTMEDTYFNLNEEFDDIDIVGDDADEIVGDDEFDDLDFDDIGGDDGSAAFEASDDIDDFDDDETVKEFLEPEGLDGIDDFID